MSGRFDARAYWGVLSLQQQRAIGEATLVTLVGFGGRQACAAGTLPPSVGERWRHAIVTVWSRIAPLVPDATNYPEGPDLAALGIRACRVCGCTEESACVTPEGVCHWVAADLCSCCAGQSGGPLAAEMPADMRPGRLPYALLAVAAAVGAAVVVLVVSGLRG